MWATLRMWVLINTEWEVIIRGWFRDPREGVFVPSFVSLQSPTQTDHQNSGLYQRSICICGSCVIPLASKISLAAARGVLRLLTLNLCGVCAAAICAHGKKGFSHYRRDLYSQTMWCNFYANLFIIAPHLTKLNQFIHFIRFKNQFQLL